MAQKRESIAEWRERIQRERWERLAQHGAFREVNGSVYYDDCATCQGYLAEGRSFFPPHVPSDRCESGKRNHCTCGICF